ncbi:glycine--tRNA ligase subunit beta [Shigella flexneri]
MRIIVQKNLNLDLQTLTEEAVRLYGDKLTNANVVDDVIDFMLGRFRAWYQDEGYTVDTIQAVLARRPTRPADFDARMKAVSHSILKQLLHWRRRTSVSLTFWRNLTKC